MSAQKALVAEALAKRVKDGETIGFGSGSTTELAIEAIGRRIKDEGIAVYCVPTSYRTTSKAKESGITVISAFAVDSLDWAFDGADEVDTSFNMIKGRGAAMLSEKVMALKSKKLIILVSEDKLVDSLGSKFAVPVEVVPEAASLVKKALEKMGAEPVQMREAEKKYGPVVTEHGNLILDAKFNTVPVTLEGDINSLVGVVENGLFIGMNPEVILAKGDKVYSRTLVNGELKEIEL